MPLTANPNRATRVTAPPQMDPTQSQPLEAWDRLTRAASIKPGTWSEENLTVEAIISTGAPVQRRDSRGPFIERLDLDSLNAAGLIGAPVLDSHRQDSARSTIGVVQDFRRDGSALVAVIRLTAAEDAAATVMKIKEGVIRGVSIGYRVARWSESIDPATKTRVRTAAAWEIFEVSAVAVPADPGARFRGEHMPETIETTAPETAQSETR